MNKFTLLCKRKFNTKKRTAMPIHTTIRHIHHIVSLFIFGIFLPANIRAQERNEQNLRAPSIWIEIQSTGNHTTIRDKQDSTKTHRIDNLVRYTNNNPSLPVGDSLLLPITYNRLPSDDAATIFTAYHTEENDIAGLWEIRRDTNTLLWLNTQEISYAHTSIRYRETTEQGIIIHTAEYHYPETGDEQRANTADTLIIGKESNHYGAKDFCEYIYIRGSIPKSEQQKWESYLAIKYGATLHDIYIDSRQATLWNSRTDSLYSAGIAGIGRDGTYPLEQKASRIYKDSLTIEQQSPFQDKEYILWGRDEGENTLSETIISSNDNPSHRIERTWKLRPHLQTPAHIRLTYHCPPGINPENLALTLGSGDAENNPIHTTHRPARTDATKAIFDSITIHDNENRYINITVDTPTTTARTPATKSSKQNLALPTTTESMHLETSPNPSNGDYTLTIQQPNPQALTIHINDINGKTIHSENIEHPLSTHTLKHHIKEAGIYLIHVQSPTSEQSTKIIISK